MASEEYAIGHRGQYVIISFVWQFGGFIASLAQCICLLQKRGLSWILVLILFSDGGLDI